MFPPVLPAYTVHPGNGPHLLLLHGFLSSSSQWLHNLGALAQVCTPVTVDLYGHGKSPAPTDKTHYHPAAYIAALEQIRAELGAEQIFVGGYSLGAGITIRYTCQHPQKVLGHFFTNSASAVADTEQMALWQREAQETAQKIKDNGLAAIRRIPVHPRFAKRLPGDIYATLTAQADHLVPIGVANTMLNTTPNASIRDIAALNPRPALLCHGVLERRFESGRNWAVENMANLQVVALNAGHAVNMEDATGFNKAVCQFIIAHTP